MPTTPPPPDVPPGSIDAAEFPRGVEPLRAVLAQLDTLVCVIHAERYRQQPVTTFGGSIGGHVRHCLDHVAALLEGIEGGVIDYEARERGSTIEADPAAARERLAALDQRLASLADLTDMHPVTTAVLLSPDSAPLLAPSSLGRELAFVLSHTIHHNAMIGGMVTALGGTVPEGFGYAPGTLGFRQRSA